MVSVCTQAEECGLLGLREETVGRTEEVSL